MAVTNNTSTGGTRAVSPITRKTTTPSLKYGQSQNVTNYKATVTDEEDEKIKEWINKEYGMYSDTYKQSAYKDAYDAVANKKTQDGKQALREKERKERSEKIAIASQNPSEWQQLQIYRAEGAYADAADIIREGQQKNGVKVDESLTDKETVEQFIQANTEQPFAEYVNRFLDSKASGGTYYNNEWLAAKLGLRGETEETLYNARDTLNAGSRGFAQGTVDLAQNTIGAGAEWLGSHIGAGLGEGAYWLADTLGADTSEGTVWDKMKQAKAYSRDEAKKQASSKEALQSGTLSENQTAFNVGEGLGQTATEIALTAPAEGLVSGVISASKLPTAAKWAANAANAYASGIGFQAADDLTQGQMSDLSDYNTSGLINMATAGIGNGIGKAWKAAKGTASKTLEEQRLAKAQQISQGEIETRESVSKGLDYLNENGKLSDIKTTKDFSTNIDSSIKDLEAKQIAEASKNTNKYSKQDLMLKGSTDRLNKAGEEVKQAISEDPVGGLLDEMIAHYEKIGDRSNVIKWKSYRSVLNNGKLSSKQLLEIRREGNSIYSDIFNDKTNLVKDTDSAKKMKNLIDGVNNVIDSNVEGGKVLRSMDDQLSSLHTLKNGVDNIVKGAAKAESKIAKKAWAKVGGFISRVLNRISFGATDAFKTALTSALMEGNAALTRESTMGMLQVSEKLPGFIEDYVNIQNKINKAATQEEADTILSTFLNKWSKVNVPTTLGATADAIYTHSND